MVLCSLKTGIHLMIELQKVYDYIKKRPFINLEIHY
jgi:hypothetical protein